MPSVRVITGVLGGSSQRRGFSDRASRGIGGRRSLLHWGGKIYEARSQENMRVSM